MKRLAYKNNYSLIGRLDEVGRWSIGGPLVCVLVIISKEYPLYFFDKHKVYLTELHGEIIKKIK